MQLPYAGPDSHGVIVELEPIYRRDPRTGAEGSMGFRLDRRWCEEKAGMGNRVLLVTDDEADANTLGLLLRKSREGTFAIARAHRLTEALVLLEAGGIHVIVIDLALPDSSGIETFDRIYSAAPQIPIMTINAPGDEKLAMRAVRHGSQGYLTKGHFGSELVPQSLRNSILRKAAEESVFIEKTRAEIVLNAISDAVIATDTHGCIDFLNVAAEKMTGWSPSSARGHAIGEVMQILCCTTREPQQHPIEIVLAENRARALSSGTIMVCNDGTETAIEDAAVPIHDSCGNLAGAVMVFHDVASGHDVTLKMAHLAQHDFLTNLPNRVLLRDRINQAILHAERSGTSVAVLFLDLDNFKHVNDSLGHGIGDRLLESVAQRLCACVRGSDTVCRQGGDEFIVLVPESRRAEDATLTAEKIIAALTEPHRIDNHELHVTTSIGISIYPDDGIDAETLIRNADTAMYQAKEKGRNNYQFFRADMNERAVERQIIETQLRRALQRHELVLQFQPKIDLRNGSVIGAEALLRWRHHDWGLVLPARFIAIAEECGLILPIGRWVLREACARTKEWDAAGLRPGSIAVNVSGLEFRRDDFVANVRGVLRETGLAPDRLELEITESMLMRNTAASTATMRELKEMGVRLAVDDFGTGYSSLSQLKQFPIDVLKIDQSFVHEIGSVAGNGIVGAIIAMAGSLKQQVVAEGVEAAEQLAFLQLRNCAGGQGYLFSQPLGAKEYGAFLRGLT
jgi:diguanylate cyclase (GGDEF)-like protein/PAS domain S-box-containing protein